MRSVIDMRPHMAIQQSKGPRVAPSAFRSNMPFPCILSLCILTSVTLRPAMHLRCHQWRNRRMYWFQGMRQGAPHLEKVHLLCQLSILHR